MANPLPVLPDPWMFGWDQLLQLAQTIVIALAAMAGWFGVRTWRAERRDRRRAEIAEDAMQVLYDAPETFQSIRNPASSGGEGSSRRRDDNEKPEETAARDLDFVPLERINNSKEYFGRAAKLRSLVRIYFGEDAAKPLSTILKSRLDIIFAVRMKNVLSRRDTSKMKPEDQEKHYNKIQGYEDTFWGDENDDFAKRIKAAVSDMEKFALPELHAKSGTRGKH